MFLEYMFLEYLVTCRSHCFLKKKVQLNFVLIIHDHFEYFKVKIFCGSATIK